ncbi:MAG TPA: ergothioneine biosynthesis protein EgtC [Pseudonocardiaceae bacterium]|jgi:glutamine amidotransferase|nr:ergothioneine biosynthesis protein EgtC [Pseudonocardiaceae bacterium]
MCRHTAYLGPPCSLADLLLNRPHALLRQSWAPCDMRGGGTVNADGFGAGWFPGTDADPVRYRRAIPLWTDGNFAALAGTITSGAVLAAIRSATVGMPINETACAPFTWDRWLFSHNGRITGWPDSVAKLAAEPPITDILTLEAPTDSALLFAVLRHRIRSGTPPADALAGLVTEVAAAAPGSRLNLLLTDGETVLATTWTHGLSVLAGDDSVVVASEPWDDDPAWTEVPDRHLVLATRSGVRLRHLDT